MFFAVKFIIFMLAYRSFSSGFRVFNRIHALKSYTPFTAQNYHQLPFLLRNSASHSDANIKRTRKEKALPPERQLLVDCLKSQDPVIALELLKTYNVSNDKKNAGVLSQLVTVFNKKEHVDVVSDIVNRLKNIGIVPSEAVLSALIRCHTDGKDVDGAFGVVKFMLDHNVPTKLRTLHPILENLYELKDFERFAVVLKHISSTLDPRTEQLSLFLNMLAQNPDANLSDVIKRSFDDFYVDSSGKLLGLPINDIQQIVAHLNKITVDEQKELGVLVDRIPPYILDKSNLRTSGYVTSKLNHQTNPASDMKEALPSIVNSDPSNPIVQGEEAEIQEYVEKLFVRQDFDTIRKSSAPMKGRIVNIDAVTCRCPNCNATLSSLALTDEEKTIIRKGVRGLSKDINAQLTHFKGFLQSCLEFDYVIDAANVAYFRQNDRGMEGKFSYKQLELLVNKLRERSDRILIVIPSIYTANYRPNSITGGSDHMTQEEKKILNNLFNVASVYQVPKYVNDDWFWIYCSVLGNRRSNKPTYVVSNDLTRDHKPAFPDSITFTRWRLTQMVYFDFFRDDDYNSRGVDTEVFLYEPSKFSRLMQKNTQPSNGETRWHIPAIDRSSWMCAQMGVSPPIKQNVPVSKVIPPQVTIIS